VRLVVSAIATGLGFGYVLARIGFTSWDEVNRMFTLADARLLLSFAGAVALLLVTWPLLARLTSATWPTRPIHRGSLLGGVLFGAGWAVTGACPAVAFAQLGTGEWVALASVAGIVCGNAAFGYLRPRLFRWSTASCSDD